MSGLNLHEISDAYMLNLAFYVLTSDNGEDRFLQTEMHYYVQLFPTLDMT